jgi:phospholipase A2
MALCDQEKTFRQQRKENIKENMKKLLGPKKSEGLYSTRDVSLEILNVITV